MPEPKSKRTFTVDRDPAATRHARTRRMPAPRRRKRGLLRRLFGMPLAPIWLTALFVAGLYYSMQPQETAPPPAKPETVSLMPALPLDFDLDLALDEPEALESNPEMPFDLVAKLQRLPIWQLSYWDGKSQSSTATGTVPDALAAPDALWGDAAKPIAASTDSTVIRHESSSLSDVPQLAPGQTLVLLLPTLPRQLMSLNVVFLNPQGLLYAGSSQPWLLPPPKDLPEPQQWQGEFVTIRFNDITVWSRWRSGAESWEKILIAPDLVHDGSGDNRLVITNGSSRPLLIDTLWLEPLQAEAPTFVALRNAEWVTDTDLAEYLPHIAIDLPLYNKTVELAKVALQYSAELAEPFSGEPVELHSLARRRQDWQRDPLRTAELPNDCDQLWRRKLDHCLAMHAEPVAFVRIASERQLPALLHLAQRFGSYIRYWRFDASDGKLTEKAARLLHARFDGITVACNPFPLTAAPEAVPALWRSPAEFGFERFITDLRRQFIDAELWHGLTTRSWFYTDQLINYRSLDRQGRGMRMIVEHTIAWISSGGGPVVLGGGELNGAIFPYGCKNPTASWPVLRELCVLGEGEGKTLVANVVAHGDYGTTETRAVGIEHDSKRVSLRIYTGSDAERQMHVTVPVPWTTGKTRIHFRAFSFNRQGAPKAVEMQSQTVETISVGYAAQNGVVRFAVRGPEFIVARIFPEAADLPRRPLAISRHAATATSIPVAADLVQLAASELPDNSWVEQVFPPYWRAAPLTEGFTVTTVPATPGIIQRVQNVVPRNAESLQITIGAAAVNLRNGTPALEIPMDRDAFRNARQLRFWVRATASAEVRHVNLLIGSAYAMGMIKLPVNTWQCLRIDWQQLFPGFMPRPILTVLAHSSMAPFTNNGSVTFEFNGFIAVGDRTPAGQLAAYIAKARALPKPREFTEPLRYIILAEAGKPVACEIRLPEAVMIDQVKATSDGLAWEFIEPARLLRLTFPNGIGPADLSRWSRNLDAQEFALCHDKNVTPIGISILRK